MSNSTPAEDNNVITAQKLNFFWNGISPMMSGYYGMNLLHNADWGFSLINNNGHSGAVAANALCIDRWKGGSSTGGTVTPVPGSHITLANGTVIQQEIERISESLLNQTVVFAYQDDENDIYKGLLKFPSSIAGAADSQNIGALTVTIGFRTISACTICGISKTDIPYIVLTANRTVNIRRVWLELGTYCHMVTTPPLDYAINKVICQEFINKNTAGYHNSIYRGKFLGTSVTAGQWAAMTPPTVGQEAPFTDLYIGDYWTINNINWRIAAFDYWFGFGDVVCNTHHAIIIPDTCLLSGGGNKSLMHGSSNTTGAYAGTDYRNGTNGNTAKSQCTSIINQAFGNGHILSYREYIANATSNEYESTAIWGSSSVEIMDEQMVFGRLVFGNIKHGTNVPMLRSIGNIQFPLFNINKAHIKSNSGYWLRNIVADGYFASVDTTGYSNNNSATNTLLSIRPVFGICA